MYEWLLTALKQAFREERLLKRSPRGSVHLLRHEAGGQRFVLRRFTGNAEVYRRLLHCTCRNLPAVYEVASQGEENLVLEEYIQGDNLGDLLQGALFTVEETRSVVDQVCRALWVLHSLGAVHRDVKPDNIIPGEARPSSSTSTPPGSTSRRRRQTPRSWAPPALPPRSSTACPRPTSARTSLPWAC